MDRVFKKGSGKPSMTRPESVDEALCFGWIDGIRKRIDADRYMIRFTPRRTGNVWSVANIGRVAALIEDGRMRPVSRRDRLSGAGQSMSRALCSIPLAVAEAAVAVRSMPQLTIRVGRIRMYCDDRRGRQSRCCRPAGAPPSASERSGPCSEPLWHPVGRGGRADIGREHSRAGRVQQRVQGGDRPAGQRWLPCRPRRLERHDRPPPRDRRPLRRRGRRGPLRPLRSRPGPADRGPVGRSQRRRLLDLRRRDRDRSVPDAGCARRSRALHRACQGWVAAQRARPRRTGARTRLPRRRGGAHRRRRAHAGRRDGSAPTAMGLLDRQHGSRRVGDRRRAAAPRERRGAPRSVLGHPGSGPEFRHRHGLRVPTP